jgi:hypothetical protein
MRGGAVPPILLFLALGLALAFAPRNARLPSLLAVLATTAAFSLLPLPRVWIEGIFLGCWISVIATAASVHIPRGIGRFAALAISINAGVWGSAVVSLSGTPRDLALALSCVFILFPASWVIGRYGSIPIKVASSWIVAVAVLAGTLQLLPVTPGYLPDHME